MDLTETIAPKTDQQNYDDYLAGPRSVTVSAVNKGSQEQPVNVELAEYPGRPFKPNLSMRRVLFTLWGAKGDAYVGRRMVLFGNPDVVYGGKAVGGVEIAAMSDIGNKPRTVSLTATRGRKRSFTVQPLPDLAPGPQEPEPWRAQWQAIQNALKTAGYEGDSKALLATAGQVIGADWSHPNKISPEDAQKVLAAVREDDHHETPELTQEAAPE